MRLSLDYIATRETILSEQSLRLRLHFSPKEVIQSHSLLDAPLRGTSTTYRISYSLQSDQNVVTEIPAFNVTGSRYRAKNSAWTLLGHSFGSRASKNKWPGLRFRMPELFLSVHFAVAEPTRFARLTQQNRQQYAEAEREKPKRRRGGAKRTLETREAYGVARVEAHPILMATFEQQEDARGDYTVE